MLNISSTPAVSWPPAPGVAVAPVTPVTPVQPAKGSTHDAQSDTGQRKGAQPERGRHPADHGAGRVTDQKQASRVQAAPLLPYKPDGIAEGKVDVPEAAAKEAIEAQQEQAEEQVEQKRLKLQEVLSSVWQASAAVVDLVLGRNASGKAGAPVEALGNQSDTGPDLTAASASLIQRKTASPVAKAEIERPALPWTGRGSASGDTAEPATAEVQSSVAVDPTLLKQVVSYDESGASNFMPLEAGSLVSERA